MLTVVCAAILNDGKILLEFRKGSNFPETNGKWGLIGGKQERGESRKAAVAREALEEIRCRVSVQKLIYKSSPSIWTRDDGVRFKVTFVCYQCTILEGTPVLNDPHASRLSWHSFDDIEKLSVTTPVTEVIQILRRK